MMEIPLTLSMEETNPREPVRSFIRRSPVDRRPRCVEFDYLGMGNDKFMANKENVDPFGSLLNQGIVLKKPLPSWYPRVPLQDITDVMSFIRGGKMDDTKKKDDVKKDYGCRSCPLGSSCGMYSHVYESLGGPMKTAHVPMPASKRAPSLRREFR